MASTDKPDQTTSTRRSRWRRVVLRVLLWVILLPLALIGTVVVLIYTPPVQNLVRAKAIGFLEGKFGTPVRLDHFALRYPAGVSLEGLLVLDELGDTLLHAGVIKSDLSLGALLDGRIELLGTELAHVRAIMVQRPDSTFNFTYIIRAFAGSDTTKTDDAVADSAAPMPFSMSGLVLEDVRFDMTLAPSDLGLRVRLGKLDLDMDAMDAAALRFHAGTFTLSNTRVDLRITPGPEEPDTYPDLENPLASLDITFEQLGLEQVGFSLKDTGTGDSLWVDLGKGDVVNDSIAFEHQRIHLKSALLDGIDFGMLTHEGTMVVDTGATAPPPWLDQHDGFRYWTRGLDIGVRELMVAHGNFQMHADTIKATSQLLDARHLTFNDIELRANDVVLNEEAAAARIGTISAMAADATRLQGHFNVIASPAEVRLEEGTIAAAHTKVVFNVMAMPGDLSTAYRSPERVPLQGHVSSKLDLIELQDLLAQFGVALPKPLNVQEVWDTDLAFSGTTQRIDTVRVDIIGDHGTIVHLLGDAQDPAALPNSVFHMDLREIVMGDGLRDIAAAYMPADVPMPTRLAGRIRASGSGRGMEADLALQSDLGDIEGHASMGGRLDHLPDDLSADLVITDFALHRFTGDTSIGLVSAHVIADGEALNTSQRSGHIEVTPSRLWYHGQDLSGSHLIGSVEGDSIHADVNTTAPSLKITLHTDVRWPVGSDTVAGDLALRVDHLGLKELGWYPYPLSVQGEWNGAGTFSTDGFAAFTLQGDSVILSNPERSFRFEEFAARGRLASDSTLLQLDTDALEVDYSTNVPADSLLPRATEKLLSFFRTDSAFVPAPGNRMDLRVALPRTEWLTGLVLPDLKAIELKDFTGHYDSDADALQLNIDLPELRYQNISVTDLRIAADSKANALNGSLRIDSVRYDAWHVDGLALTAASGPDKLHTRLTIQKGDGFPDYVVPVDFERENDEISLHVGEGLVLDTLPWEVDPQNMIRFTDTGPMAEHFILSSGPQRIELATSADSTVVHLEEFNMGNVLNIVSTDDTTAFVDGAITGEVSLPLSASGSMRTDLHLEEVVLVGHPLGDVVVHAHGSGPDRYEGTVRFENGPNVLDATARFDGGGAEPVIETHANIGLSDMAFLEPFASGFLYEISGGMKGVVDWRMADGKSRIHGDMTFTDTELGVVRTGARYTLRNERILADEAGITFNDFTVLDSLGNAFVLDGQVLTQDLSSMRFDLGLRTDSFQLVNSPPAPDALFYGDLFTSVDVRITGTDRAPVVKGDLGLLPGTDLSVVLPGSKVEIVESEGIVVFTTDLAGTDTGHVASTAERLRDSLQAQLPKVDLDLRLHIDPRAEFAIVLDPTTGDQATFQGDGDLRFRYTPDGEMFLDGPFTVSEGGYTLEFYGLVKKRFDLVPGSQVVWTGDPLDARMDIKARYTSMTSGYPLVANASGTVSEAEQNRLKTRMPFEVLINIAGDLEDPALVFGLDLPREYRNSYPKVSDELDRLAEKSREDERNRQVFGLLVLNSFIVDESAGGAPSSSLASSAARNSVNGILTDQMNKLTGQYIKGVDIQLGVSTVDQIEGNSTYQRTSFDYKVSKSFLDERLSFEVGGSVGVNERQNNVSNVSNTRAAQYAILYDLTRDGRFRLRGFYENAYDLYDGDITDSGVALMYTRDLEENEKAREAAREAARQQQQEEVQRRKKERERKDPTPSPTPEERKP